MRAITKGVEPASLTAHRHTAHGGYDNFADKAGLRRALVREQRGLCCYCMGRIRGDGTGMKIEHWRCQRRHRNQELDYRNLLAACSGGGGRPGRLQHCDTKKGDRRLRWNPADPAHRVETRLRYELDGAIRSDDAEFDDQLDRVLNLNLSVLKNNRKGVWDAFLEWWGRERRRRRGPVSRERIERQRDRWSGGSGDLRPYCGVAILVAHAAPGAADGLAWWSKWLQGRGAMSWRDHVTVDPLELSRTEVDPGGWMTSLAEVGERIVSAG